MTIETTMNEIDFLLASYDWIERSKRGTGRTIVQMSKVRPGDVVICSQVERTSVCQMLRSLEMLNSVGVISTDDATVMDRTNPNIVTITQDRNAVHITHVLVSAIVQEELKRLRDRVNTTLLSLGVE